MLSGQEFDDNIHSMIESCNFDDWAVAVKGRMESTVGDLFSRDAVYHLTCYVRFENKLPHTPHKAKRGRPVKDDAMTVFNKVCVDLT